MPTAKLARVAITASMGSGVKTEIPLVGRDINGCELNRALMVARRARRRHSRRMRTAVTSLREGGRRTSPRAGRTRTRSRANRAASPGSASRQPPMMCCRALNVTWNCGATSHSVSAPPTSSRLPSTSSIGVQARPKPAVRVQVRPSASRSSAASSSAEVGAGTARSLHLEERVVRQQLVVHHLRLEHGRAGTEAVRVVAGRQRDFGPDAQDRAALEIVMQHVLEGDREIARAGLPAGRVAEIRALYRQLTSIWLSTPIRCPREFGLERVGAVGRDRGNHDGLVLGKRFLGEQRARDVEVAARPARMRAELAQVVDQRVDLFVPSARFGTRA